MFDNGNYITDANDANDAFSTHHVYNLVCPIFVKKLCVVRKFWSLIATEQFFVANYAVLLHCQPTHLAAKQTLYPNCFRSHGRYSVERSYQLSSLLSIRPVISIRANSELPTAINSRIRNWPRRTN